MRIKTFDERLEFVFKSTESLHASMHEAHEEQQRRWTEQESRWKKTDEQRSLLTTNVNRIEVQVEKLTKVMAAIGQTVLDHQDWIEKHA